MIVITFTYNFDMCNFQLSSMFLIVHIYQTCIRILCFVDRASLYNLVNKTNLVHNLFLVYLFIVYLSISTCFR